MFTRIMDIRSLPVQMISAFVALVILATVTVGVPSITILQRQLDQQARSQLEQGQRAARALYDAQMRELANLATLTAQRPTLHQLLDQQDQAALRDYLETLKSGAGIDWIEICEGSRAIVSTETSLDVCGRGISAGFHAFAGASQPKDIWMIVDAPLEHGGGTQKVILGTRLDDAFALEMRTQTGLEHIFCVGGEPVATSFLGGAEALAAFAPCEAAVDNLAPASHELGERPYYLARASLAESGAVESVAAVVALDITEIVRTKSRTVLWMLMAILGVSIAGTVLGVLFSRRLSQPLVQLSETADKFSQGDLETPVEIDTQVREVAQVARALEGARGDLLSTLTSLQSERNWRDHLLESIVEGIVILDDQQRITFFSRGAERITGWQREEMIGRACDEVFRLAGSQQPFSSAIPPLGGRAKADVLLADGREASLAITGAKLAPAEATGSEVALVFRDISEEEAVHRILGHFLANVAHEFRTPLSALAASIELLLDQAPELSQEELQELLISLHLGTLGLQTLVDNLLESASIEAGRFRVSPRATDLGDVIAEAVKIMQPLLDKYEQRFVVELPVDIPVVRADPRRTLQVVVNLLSNASKYGPADSEILLSVARSPDQARVAVADRGPGISQAVRANLFRRFVYPDAESPTAQAGAGLGLSVVKAIVDAHGGQVGVEDRPGGGSIFWFTLPVAGPQK
jgi:PAS domain S-box-containing protein